MGRTKNTARKADRDRPMKQIAKADALRDAKQMKKAKEESMKTSRAQRKALSKK